MAGVGGKEVRDGGMASVKPLEDIRVVLNFENSSLSNCICNSISLIIAGKEERNQL